MSAFATLASDSAELSRAGMHHLSDSTQDGARALEAFLAGVERKAFRIAQVALRHEADALDVVQDSMLQLAHRYAGRPHAEWKPLFYRILENRIRDVQRRRMVRNRVMAWMPWHGEDEEEQTDLIEQAADLGPQPPAQLESQEIMQALER